MKVSFHLAGALALAGLLAACGGGGGNPGTCHGSPEVCAEGQDSPPTTGTTSTTTGANTSTTNSTASTTNTAPTIPSVGSGNGY
jgi:hypothetical protein